MVTAFERLAQRRLAERGTTIKKTVERLREQQRKSRRRTRTRKLRERAQRLQKEREAAQRLLAITRPKSDGGTITITRSGKVTDRDAKGKVIKVQRITLVRASSILRSEAPRLAKRLQSIKNISESRIKEGLRQGKTTEQIAVKQALGITASAGLARKIINEQPALRKVLNREDVAFRKLEKKEIIRKEAIRATKVARQPGIGDKALADFTKLTAPLKKKFLQRTGLDKFTVQYEILKRALIFPRTVIKGLDDIHQGLKTQRLAVKDRFIKGVKNFNGLIKTSIALKKKAKTGKKLTKQEAKTFATSLKKFRVRELKDLKVLFRPDPKARQFLSTEAAGLTATLAVGAVAIALGAGIGGAIAGITKFTATTIGAITTIGQARETLRDPSPENLGTLGFFVLGLPLAIVKFTRKLSPNFKPTVKNVGALKLELTKTQNKFKQDLIKSKAAKQKVKSFLIQRRLKKIDRGFKDLNAWQKDSRNVIANDFNPKIYNKLLQKYSGKITSLSHVSTQPVVRKLFKKGIPVGKQPTKKELIQRIKAKAGKIVQDTPRNLPTRKKFDKIVVSMFKRFGVVLGGGKALNLQTPLLRRRFTSDIDAKVSGNKAKGVLQSIARAGNKAENSANRYVVKKGGFKDTWKLIDSSRGEILIEVTNVPGKKLNFVTNPQGLRVEKRISLLIGKADSLSKAERFQRKGKIDLKDVARLTRGKVKVKDILPESKNPSKVLQVFRQASGMGRDRLKFGESHLFFDFEVPIAYSQGVPYSIIKIPLKQVSRFSKTLRVRVSQAARGRLSSSQSDKLRRDLNSYIKANPNKFFAGPRTSSLPIGEREWVLAETSRIVKKEVYKTFDNDLKKFINIIEAGFGKQQKTSLARKFMTAYRKKPFTQLRLRLTNPDVLRMRRFARLVERDLVPFTKIKRGFLGLFSKVVARPKEILKKVLAKLKKKLPKKKITKKLEKIKKKKKLRRVVGRPLTIREKKKLRQLVRQEKVLRLSLKKLNAARIKSRGTTRRRIKRRVKQVVRKINLNIRKRRIIKRAAKPPVRVIRKPPTRKVPPRKPPRKIPPRKPPIRRPPRIASPRRPPPRRPPKPPFKKPPKRPFKKPPLKRRLKKKIKKKVKIVKEALKGKQFIFIEDLIARIEGQRATKGQRRKLLKVGRIFTGLERRRKV